jgi:hypothetical protein
MAVCERIKTAGINRRAHFKVSIGLTDAAQLL